MVVKCTLPDIPIPDQPLADILYPRILEHGDKIAMIDTTANKTITFNEVYERSRKCAGALSKLGLKPKDVVGINAPSCTEFPVITLALLACGATITTVNPTYKEGEVIQQFSISEPRMVFAAEDAVDTVKGVAQKIRSIQKIFVIGKSEEFPTVDSLIESGKEEDFPRHVDIDAQNDVALLLYSSGTTGMPKSVMLTHYALSACMAVGSANFGCERSFYTDRPMFHVGGMLGLIIGLHGAHKLVQEQAFDVERMLRAIERYKVTNAATVPPIGLALLNLKDSEKYDTSSLEQLDCGGAACSPALLTGLAKKFNVKVIQGYGMTESGWIAYQGTSNGPVESVGRIVHNTSAKIIDLHSGKELGANEDGEILVKGPQLMKGYLKNPEATSQTLDADGWLHTGDIGHFDADENLYVIDRLKEVIKYKTFQVPPAEIESTLLRHPKVADVGVIGIPDKLAGEIPMAFVVRSDQSLTEEDVTKFVAGELADYKQLRGGVRFTAAIPKSVQGKIQRKELKKMAEEILQE